VVLEDVVVGVALVIEVEAVHPGGVDREVSIIELENVQ
jgi:hypothetical protein